MRLEFKSISIPSATLIADEFIDKEMVGANGEYVKIYLYLLRHAGENVEKNNIADALEMIESDVDRAIAYWKRTGLISEVVQEVSPERNDKITVVKTDEDRHATDFTKLESDDAFKELLYMIQKYMGATFNATNTEIVAHLYDGLGMSAEILGYLAEYCATCGKRSMRYYEKVALDWYNRGITSVEEAKENGSRYTAEVYSVLKEFGINRTVTPTEMEYITKWYHEYVFTQEIIIEACKRTIIGSGGPNFKYADSILKDWHNKNVRTISDIVNEDKIHGEKNKTSPATSKSSKNNKFHNLEERDDDLDESAFEKMQEELKKYN